jgi:hypothetical protein
VGQSLSPSSDFRQLSLGADYNLLRYGAWRLRAGVEASVGGPNPDLMLRYLSTVGFTEYFVQVSGTSKLRTVSPGLNLVYVAPWAGEYGLGIEARLQHLSFDADNVAKDIPGVSGLALPGISISKSSTDPFLTAHAAFVQQYPDYAVFARFGLAFNLKSAVPVASATQAQFGAVDPSLLEALMPRKEVKVSVGMRF